MSFSIILLTPGLQENYPGYDNRIIDSIKDEIGGHVPIIGGAAGDDFRYKKTYQFANGNYYNNSLVMLVLAINLNSRCGVAHGCIPTNYSLMVTESFENSVHKLNHWNAASVYEELAGFGHNSIKGITEAGVKAPFAIVDQDERYWMKLPIMEEEQSLHFYSKVPEKSSLVLMKPDKKKTIKSVKEAILAGQSKNDLGALIFFNSAARKQFLKENVEEEFKQINKIAKNTPFIGLHTYGEFGSTMKASPHVLDYSFVSFALENKLVTEK